MIILYGVGAGFGLPEISPYVTKTEVQLKMAGLAYRKEHGQREQSPKGQLPFIDAGGERIADSTFIRGFLERTYGIDFDEGLDSRQRAEAWAVERMCENHLAWTGVHARWLIPENFAKGPAQFFAGAPPAVRDEVLAAVGANLRAVGVGRHSEAEIVALGVRSLAALSVLLDDRPYLMGSRPCGADATVFAILAFILTPYFDSELRTRAEGFANLVAYGDRLMAQFYPEFPWRAATKQPEAALA
ncbi:glutathione S-transferase family protein [Phenylobacterium hankyongense]|uniref:Glutathione S-transferase family protein n=1 Tax=Phenylobacterium hankyongense TaxID=1813876 RepID=A0A328B3S7_9CAUL|nr:glutathione S-transferase family protein [Phenylobacterium hankyongense]RAK59658.1 glutathione S-transferase family protein [Phenylobacterium hankyongense]